RRGQAEAGGEGGEARRIQDALDPPPDPADPHAFITGGKLHPRRGKEEAAPLRAEDQGTLPNELLEGVPPGPATHPIDPDPDKGTVYPQPISVSLNKD